MAFQWMGCCPSVRHRGGVGGDSLTLRLRCHFSQRVQLTGKKAYGGCTFGGKSIAQVVEGPVREPIFFPGKKGELYDRTVPRDALCSWRGHRQTRNPDRREEHKKGKVRLMTGGPLH